MKRFAAWLGVILLASSLFAPIARATDYSDSHLMDDQIMDKVGSMTLAQIRDFLNGTDGKLSGGSACLKSYSEHNFHFNSSDGHWYYGDNTRSTGDYSSPSSSLTSAKWNTTWGPANIPVYQIIYQAAQEWGINPQVLIATLQKEESLVSNGSNTTCASYRYWSAMGYDCPDSRGTYTYSNLGIHGTCVKDAAYAGFGRQVLWGAWQLEFNRQRSEGNTAWDGDGSIPYSSFMTRGTFQRCDSCASTFYNGYATIDNHSVFMSTGATASLYAYTPHLNQSFPYWFEQWFGSTLNPSTGPGKVWRLRNKGADELLTVSINERDRVIQCCGYWSDGAVFIDYFNQATTDLVPVYRSFNPAGGFHFYTTSLSERAAVEKAGYNPEGVSFYAMKVATTGWRPVYRLLNTKTGQHFFTASTSERSGLISKGWKAEGVAWYAQ